MTLSPGLKIVKMGSCHLKVGSILVDEEEFAM